MFRLLLKYYTVNYVIQCHLAIFIARFVFPSNYLVMVYMHFSEPLILIAS